MNSLLETPGRIEPTRLETYPEATSDLIGRLSAESTRLGARLHPATGASLAALVRAMNCYYSNKIEGHNTRPRDIERALANDLDADETTRNLQIEARNHIRLQAEIDRMHAQGRLGEPAATGFIRWLHEEFYRDAPEAMLRVGEGERQFTMTPGVLRSQPHEEVAVGGHRPPSSERVADFMAYFEERFRLEGKGPAAALTMIAIAHHRLNYIHPFADGNGRVSRLMSHAMGLKAGIGAHGLWSVSRGLARGIEHPGEYHEMMAFADTLRMDDLDGRGNLSLRALTHFVEWFLRVMLDQILFMAEQFDLETLHQRLARFAAARELRPETTEILHAVLVRGELPRGEASRVTGLKERTARDLLGRLVDSGVLGSQSPKTPVSLRFPTEAVEILFPRLYPPDA